VKKYFIHIIIILLAAALASCGKDGSRKYEEAMALMAFSSSGSEPSGDDVISASTNRSDKDQEKAPKLNAYEGAAFVRPPQINNFGIVALSYMIDVPPGRHGMQPGVGLSYSSGGDGLAGIGWSLSTGLGVISRTTKNGQLYYDWRDTFTFNGQRLVKVEGPANSENGTYRQEIESGFSKFVLTGAESGGVWRVYDKAGTITTFGETLKSRIYRPDDNSKTYIWNFCKSVDLNGNFMTAEYDDSEYAANHILYLKEIRYTGNEHENVPARQFVRFGYRDRDEAYVSKAPGFIMKMDRLLDTITVGWDDPSGWTETELWSYRMVYETSEDSNRPLLRTVETTRETTKPEFIYQPAQHSFAWAVVDNAHSGDPEENPDSVKYFEGDFNGDGISDMVFFNPKTGDWRAMEGKRDGGYLEKYYGKKFQGYEGPDRIQWFKGNVTGDYNGDGRSDIAFYLPQTKEFWVAEHNGKTFNFVCYGTLYIDIDIFKCEWFTGDFDGNGLSDTVLFNEPTGEWYLMANKGGRFEFIKFSEHFKNLFRSDYRPDLNLDSPSTADTSEYGKDRDKIYFLSGDYNGDGRTDISFYDTRSGRWWVGENYRVDGRGSGVVQFDIEWKLYKEFTESEKMLFAPAQDSLAGNDRFSGDFNGDGFSDFLIFHRDRGEWILGETGNGTINFRVFSRTPQFKSITRWLQGDFNGDGRTDIGFYCKDDNNFWIGEATPSGFRYRVYNNMAYGPDPSILSQAPLHRDEVDLKDAKAVVAGASSTAMIDYQYDGNYHTDRGEKAYAGYFTNAGATPELLIYNRKDNKIYLKQGSGTPVWKLDADLDDENVTIISAERPDRYRYGMDGILYYKKSSFIGSVTHGFHVIGYTGSKFDDKTIASFNSGTITDFSIAESIYMMDRFGPMADDPDKYILVLDDRAETPRFVLVNGTGSGGTTQLSVSGLSASFFENIRSRRSGFRFFSSSFTGARAQVLFADMTKTPHQWYLGSISGSSINFTKLAGTPQFMSSGYVNSYRVIGTSSGADLVYATTGEGAVNFHKLCVSTGSISQINYLSLAQGISFKGEFDAAGNPVVFDAAEVKRAVLGSTCRLEALAITTISMKRPDLLTAVYPFQWIQGDYNGDGKTDIGFFHLKESHWYFALTHGTVPDMVSEVKNGIGGAYYMTYENSTRFDNTDEEGIPRLPMNYKVCTSLTVGDGRGGKVLTNYEYSGGYAFSAFINGEKETDYFGFGKFTVVDAVGRRTVSEYYNVPYEDFRMNRALAGAFRESRSHGSNMKEYERTEHEYTIHVIVPSPPAPLPGGEGRSAQSYLIEPTTVKKYVTGVLSETRTSNIELAASKYEMISKTESVTDHYDDGVHQPVTVANYSKFENIESTNEMRLEYRKNFEGSSHETTTSYQYDDRGNVILETAHYSGTGLPAASDKIMQYAYDRFGNRVSETNASGSPARVTEKAHDGKLNQFVIEERAIGDTVTLKIGYDINYASAFGGINKKTDPNGNAAYFEYDGQGRLVRERIDADTGVEVLQTYAYSTDFPLSAKVTQNTGPSASSGSVIETRVFADGMGRTIHTVRSATDQPGKRYAKTGMIVCDAAGRVIRKSQTAWAGDDEIDAFKANITEKYPTITEYDPAGRVARVTLPEGYKGEPETSITYTYNDPWETIETHSVGRSKRTVKNARELVLYIEDSGTGDDGRAVNAKIGFAYDIAGNRVKKMDLTSPPAPLSGGDGGGMSPDIPQNLFAPGTKDASGNNIACWQYNAFDQVVHSSDPDLGYAGVVYNAFGEAASRMDGLGRITSFTYDRLGRLIVKLLPGTEGRVTYTYDALSGSENVLGRMVRINDPAQRKDFSYDKIGRVKRETRVISDTSNTQFVTGFNHDLLGRNRTIRYPTDPRSNRSMEVTYAYCPMGVTGISIRSGSDSRSIVESVAYSEFGQMTEVRRGNGTVTTYHYDIKGRMESLLTTANHNGQTWKVQDVKYEFKIDNSIAAVENAPDVASDGACLENVRYEYQYDGLNRLSHARGSYEKLRITPGSVPPPDGGPIPGATVKKFELGYGYAANGNLTAKTVYDPESGSVDDQWNYSYVNHAATEIATTRYGQRFRMIYDAAGNMTTQRDNSKNMAKQMAYDSYNRIRQVTDPRTGSVKGRYWYDDQGFRVRRVAQETVNGRDREVEILYPSMYYGVEVQRTRSGIIDPSSGLGVNNIYLNGVRIAAALPNCQARYYLTDQVDSVKVVTNDAGMVVTSHEYLPFGEDWITEGDTKNAPKYNSQELDKESGYYFYNARHYDPEIGRFVTPDTVIDGENSTQGWNRFAYVHNNPIRYKDPTGHWNIESNIPGYGKVEKGHETLTEMTLRRSNMGNDLRSDYNTYKRTMDQMIAGNRSNDDMAGGLAEFKKKHYAPEYQATHAMAKDTDRVSNTVKDIGKTIQGFTDLAQTARKSGDINKENFYLGKALHTIQDSFAPMHTERRDASDRITKVNIYSLQTDHNPNTDAIYKEGYKAKSGTLTPEAKKSIDAGVNYLNNYYDAQKRNKSYNINNGYIQKYLKVAE
jgi:RHS repeat-associated protein